MLKYNIKNLMKLRGITHPSAYLMKHGFGRGTAVRIAAEKMTGISPSHIERLCYALKCLPNDLFYWTADKGEQATDGHLLWSLRLQTLKSVTDIGVGISVDKMGKFLEDVEQLEVKYNIKE
jgi:DNA-binding Xre family transcriptional regulator